MDKQTNVLSNAAADGAPQRPKNVKQWLKQSFSVITLNDPAKERPPLYPFNLRLLHWNVADPVFSGGSREQEVQAFRDVRDQIRDKIARLTGQAKR